MIATIAVAVLLSIALPQDLPHLEDAFAHRAEQRVLAMDEWQRDEWPTIYTPTRPAEAVPATTYDISIEGYDPSYHGYGSGAVEHWRPLVAKYFDWEDVDRAMCLLRAESGGNPYAWNQQGSTATGLFQIMHSVWAPQFAPGSHRSVWHDPEFNVRVAAYIRDAQGWTAWAPYNKGKCR